MANSCGIDLGTTNSCIVIVEDGQPKVVRDKYNRAIVPSVVWQDEKENTIVGHAAKARMGQMPLPVITVKRKMGTDEKVRLGVKDRTAVEVSTMILEYLKKIGEDDAQSMLENVVVTVPAYFNFKQKQDTETSARQAGFKEVIVLQEPVAAALAYCINAGDEPMIVAAYDLGGGTFDATVLERTLDNEINVLAFGGDPWLGGDNFDTLLAEYLRKLLAKKYAVEWDLKKTEHYAKFQKLKDLAEQAKKELSKVTETPLFVPDVFTDEKGELVTLNEVISRETLYSLIEEQLERSIELMRETLERSKVPLEKITKLIMVGGSSYIPRIQERLHEVLGIKPELVDPETIVAVGAAIKASTQFGRRVNGEGITVDLDYQAKTAHPKARIAGRISHSVQGWIARLMRGEFESTREVKGERFRFDDIPLLEKKTNEFTLSLEDDQGTERLFVDISITHDESATNLRTPHALVAKRIAIRTVKGLETILDAGTRLPTKVSQTFVTQDQSGSIRVPIYEGNVLISEVQLNDVPKDLPIGSEVEVELIFSQNYSVSARARVRQSGQEARAKFDIPPIRVPTADQVKTRRESLKSRWEIACKAGGEGDETAFKELEQLIEGEFRTPEPKMAKIAEDLCELELLVFQCEALAIAQQALRPPLEDVERRLDQAEKNAHEKASNRQFDLGEFRSQASNLRNKARDAWKRRDVTSWREVISLLIGLESFAASSIDDIINRMPEPEARELAIGVVCLLEQEYTEKPATRQALSEINFDALRFVAMKDPRKALKLGADQIIKLIKLGLLHLPAPAENTAQGNRPSIANVLAGVLGTKG